MIEHIADASDHAFMVVEDRHHGALRNDAFQTALIDHDFLEPARRIAPRHARGDGLRPMRFFERQNIAQALIIRPQQLHCAQRFRRRRP